MKLLVFFCTAFPQLNHIALAQIQNEIGTSVRKNSSSTSKTNKSIKVLTTFPDRITFTHTGANADEHIHTTERKRLLSFCGNFLPLVFTLNQTYSNARYIHSNARSATVHTAGGFGIVFIRSLSLSCLFFSCDFTSFLCILLKHLIRTKQQPNDLKTKNICT